MKRYKLLKDLPTFNAGDIFEIREDGCLYWDKSNQKEITLEYPTHWQPDVMAYHKKTLERFPNILEDWFEEIEEPKGNWTIDPINEDCIDDGRYTTPDELERYEELGLKFNTREEAELAVQKLKAWERLKNKGFKFELWDYDGGNLQEKIITGRILFRVKDDSKIDEDLDICFGGKE